MNDNLLDDYIKTENSLDIMKKEIIAELRLRLKIQYPSINEEFVKKFVIRDNKIYIWLDNGSYTSEWFFFYFNYLYTDIEDFNNLELKYDKWRFEEYGTDYDDDRDDLF